MSLSDDEHFEAHKLAQMSGPQPITRACDLCRAMKVRCIPDLIRKGMCHRCASTNRDCIFKPIKTSRKKRTDVRIHELEKEVHAIRAVLQQQNAAALNFEPRTIQQTGFTGSDTASVTGTSVLSSKLPWNGEHGTGLQAPGLTTARLVAPYVTDDVFVAANDVMSSLVTQVSAQNFKDLDVIDRGLLSMETAKVLLDIYNKDLVVLAPLVLVRPNTTADDMRRSKPTLFLSILAAAAGKHNPQLYKSLNAEVRHVYRSQLFEEKSLQLVQALMVTAVWYFPPSKCRQVKSYEYIHMAATMALDIGIGTRPRKDGFGPTWKKNAVMADQYYRTQPPLEEDELESRRTFLSCYVMCTELAMSTRRPTMLRFNKWIEDCLEFVDKSPCAAASDKCLVAWAQLLRICEDIMTSFGYDGDVVSLSDSRVQLMVKSFETRLDMWNRDKASYLMTDPGRLIFHKATLYLHELGVHGDHPPEDFKPPWHIETIDPIRLRLEPTGAEINAMTTCISSAQSLISIFLSMSIDAVRSLPTHTFFSGVVYSAIILMKLDISATDPTSKLGQYINRNTLNVKRYLDGIIRSLRDAVGTEGYRVPSNFLGLLMKFQRNHDSNYRLWTSIADEDHRYDLAPEEDHSTRTSQPNTAPVPSDSMLANKLPMSADNDMPIDLNIEFDPNLLNIYNNFEDSSWTINDSLSDESMNAHAYNWL